MRPVLSKLILAPAVALLLGAAHPAFAQAPGPYGAEDGYNDDSFGWGPAYRPDTSFRPAYGFYGGVERPYPYARYPQARPERQAVRSSPAYRSRRAAFHHKVRIEARA